MSLSFLRGSSVRMLCGIYSIAVSPVLLAFDLPPQDSRNGVVLNGSPQIGLSAVDVFAIGDINLDGIADFAVSTPQTGSVYVVYGRATNNPWPLQISIDNVDGFVFRGTAIDKTGSAVARCDVNGDAIKDLLIAAPETQVQRAAQPASNQAGKIYVIFGRPNLPAELTNTLTTTVTTISTTPKVESTKTIFTWGYTILGASIRDYAGTSVACGGDINGDSIDDILIGTAISNSINSYNTRNGLAYVVYGRSFALPLPVTLPISTPDPAPTLNVDLSTDLVDGTRGFTIEAAQFRCETDAFASASVYCEGTNQNNVNAPIIRPDDFGKRVAGVGDMNGDGIPDFAISAPAASPNGVGTVNGLKQSGQAYVIFGRSSNFPAIIRIGDILIGGGSTGIAINGSGYLDHLGAAITSADINNDKLSDLILSEPQLNLNSVTQMGQTHVLFGRSSLVNPFPAVIGIAELRSGDAVGNSLIGLTINGVMGETGSSLAAVGDINADGRQDILLGAPTFVADASGEGAVFALLGRELKDNVFPAELSLDRFGPLDNGFGFIIYGDQPGDHAGSKVEGIGDVNGDDIADMVIAAAPGAGSFGKIYLLFGSATIAESEVRPAAHKGSPVKETTAGDNTLPQTGTGNGFALLGLALLGLSARRGRKRSD